MSITVNTNMSAINIQSNLERATSKMNKAMVRMSSGSKINSASDDAAGFSVKTKLANTISGTKIAEDNVAIGNDLLSTAEGVLNTVQSNLSRIQDLVIEASNGTYSAPDLSAIKTEVDARFAEISSLTTNAKFNGKTLFSGTAGQTIIIQSGATKAEQTKLTSTIFKGVDVNGLTSSVNAAFGVAMGGTTAAPSALSAKLASITSTISGITQRETDIGACQNKLDSINDALKTTATNLTSAKSTISDSDTAADSADYVQQQILQEISTTLLSSANQAANTAYTLVKGTQ